MSHYDSVPSRIKSQDETSLHGRPVSRASLWFEVNLECTQSLPAAVHGHTGRRDGRAGRLSTNAVGKGLHGVRW